MEHEILRAVELVADSDGRRRLDHVSLLLTEGGALGVVGRNGAGKDQLARVLSGEAAPDGGTLLYEEQPADLQQLRRYGQRITPASRLAENLTVYENLLLIPPGRQKIWHGRRMQLLCTELLCDFGLAEYAGAAPSSLPAVLHQRLLLVRSVVQQKRFVVIEGASDRYSEEEQRGLLDTIRAVRRRGMAVLYTSRRMDLVQAGMQRTLIMSNGRIIKMMPTRDADPAALRSHLYGFREAASYVEPPAQEGRELFALPGLSVCAGSFAVINDYDGTADSLIRLITYSCVQSRQPAPGLLDNDTLDEHFVGEMTVTDNLLLTAAPKLAGRLRHVSRRMVRLLREECIAMSGLTEAQMCQYPAELTRAERLRLLLYRFFVQGVKVFVINRPGFSESDRIGLERAANGLLASDCAVLYIMGSPDEPFNHAARKFAWHDGKLHEERK